MKRLLFVLATISVLLVACSSPELVKEEAIRLIKEKHSLPRTLDYDVFCADPADARRLLDAGLEEQGLVIIQRTQKIMDIGKPLITFTEKAKSYLLPQTDKERAKHIQKVRVAIEDVSDVQINAVTDQPGLAIVNYTLTDKEVTPFAVLYSKREPSRKYQANFISTDNGWLLEKQMH